MRTHWIRSTWVTIVNGALAVTFVLFLYDVWTDTPLAERVVLESAQATVAAALGVGILLELHRSKLARTWNITTQFLSAVLPCTLFVWIWYRAEQSGERIDGIEAILVWVGFWILVITGVTWFLYSRSGSAHHAGD